MRLPHLTRTIAICTVIACGAAFPAQAQTPATSPATPPATSTTTTPAITKPATPSLTAPAQPATSAAKHVTGKVNINSASSSELDALPNIGEKRSAAIIKARPYKSTDELVSKKVLSKGVFDSIKKYITI